MLFVVWWVVALNFWDDGGSVVFYPYIPPPSFELLISFHKSQNNRQ